MGENERKWGKNAFRCSKKIGFDDRKPMISLQEDICILSTEVVVVDVVVVIVIV